MKPNDCIGEFIMPGLHILFHICRTSCAEHPTTSLNNQYADLFLSTPTYIFQKISLTCQTNFYNSYFPLHNCSSPSKSKAFYYASFINHLSTAHFFCSTHAPYFPKIDTFPNFFQPSYQAVNEEYLFLPLENLFILVIHYSISVLLLTRIGLFIIRMLICLFVIILVIISDGFRLVSTSGIIFIRIRFRGLVVTGLYLSILIDGIKLRYLSSLEIIVISATFFWN